MAESKSKKTKNTQEQQNQQENQGAQAQQNQQTNQGTQKQQNQQPNQKYTPRQFNYQVNPQDKVRSILGYVLVVCAIVFLCMDDTSKHSKFHCAQSICLWVVALASAILAVIPILGIVITACVSCAVFIFAVWGIIQVAQDTPNPALPLVGDIAYSIFGTTIEKGR